MPSKHAQALIDLKSSRLRDKVMSAMKQNDNEAVSTLCAHLDDQTMWLVLADASTLGNVHAVSLLFPQATPNEQLQSARRALGTRRSQCLAWMCAHATDPETLSAKVMESAASRGDAEVIDVLLKTVHCDTTLALAEAAHLGDRPLIQRLLPLADPMRAVCHLLITLSEAAESLVDHLSHAHVDPDLPAHQMARRACTERPERFPRLHAFFSSLDQARALDNQTPVPPSRPGARF